MRFLAHFDNYRCLTPKDIPRISSDIESVLKEGLDTSARNIRVSTNLIQIDLFVRMDSEAEGTSIAKEVARLLEPKLGSLVEVVNLTSGLARGLDEKQVIEKAIRLFNQERYWESQETFEALWTPMKDKVKKEVVQGVILVGAALVHYQRDQDNICLSMFRRALAKLENPSYKERELFGIDIDSLKADLRDAIAQGKVSTLKLRVSNPP